MHTRRLQKEEFGKATLCSHWRACIHHKKKKKWKEVAMTHSPLNTSMHHQEGSTIRIWRGIRPHTHGKVQPATCHIF